MPPSQRYIPHNQHQSSHESHHQQPGHVPALRLNQARDTSPQYRDIIKQRSLILNDIGIRFLRQKSYQLAVNAMNQAIRGQMELAELFREQFASPQYFLNRGDAYRGLGNFQAVRDVYGFWYQPCGVTYSLSS